MPFTALRASAPHHQGAPEPILGLSTAFEAEGRVAPLDAATRRLCATVHEGLSADGLRVLAVAYCWLEPKDAYSRDDEADLVLAGFVSFAAPILPDVAEVLRELKRDGVTVKILTGDNELVARGWAALSPSAQSRSVSNETSPRLHVTLVSRCGGSP